MICADKKVMMFTGLPRRYAPRNDGWFVFCYDTREQPVCDKNIDQSMVFVLQCRKTKNEEA